MCWHHWFDGAISSNIYLMRPFHVHADEKGIKCLTKIEWVWGFETPTLNIFSRKHVSSLCSDAMFDPDCSNSLVTLQCFTIFLILSSSKESNQCKVATFRHWKLSPSIGFGRTCHQQLITPTRTFKHYIRATKNTIIIQKRRRQSIRDSEWDDLKRSEFQILWSLWSWTPSQWDKPRRVEAPQWSEM